MKKATIILQHKKLEELIGTQFDLKIENFVCVDASHIVDRFAFMECNEQTEVVVIENITTKNQILWIYPMVTEGIILEKRGKNPFTIHPRLVLLTDTFTPYDFEGIEFIYNRFDVIVLNKEVVWQQ